MVADELESNGPFAVLPRDGKESRDRLRQALAEGLKRGLITRKKLARLPDKLQLEALAGNRPDNGVERGFAAVATLTGDPLIITAYSL